MRATVIINPIAGAHSHPEDTQQRASRAAAFLSSAGVTHDIHITERPGHAYELARSAVQHGATLVFAWGGDGTMNEVARALAFSETALALIPSGSGNGLARELRVSSHPEQAIKNALQAIDRRIDVGQIDEYVFVNAAGVGFDAHVSTVFNTRPPGRRGLFSYVIIALRECFTYQPLRYDIQADGETVQARALLIALANSRQYGNGAVIAPQAQIDDGQLDLVVIHARAPLVILWQARHLFTGTLATVEGVHMQRVTQVTITGPQPLLFHVDGEAKQSTSTSLTVRLHPAALRVRTG